MKYRFLPLVLCSIPLSMLAIAGCAYEPPTTNASGSGGNGQGGMAQAGSGGAQSTGGNGGSAGAGGSGGTGGATGECTQGATSFCKYDAPENTINVGTCRTSEQTCLSGGTWSDCSMQVVPTLEACGMTDDRNCDGVEGCKGTPVKISMADTLTSADDMILAMATGKPVSYIDGQTYAVGFRDGTVTTTAIQNPRVLFWRRGPQGAIADMSDQFVFTPSGLGEDAAVATSVAVLPVSGDVAVVGMFSGGSLSIGTAYFGPVVGSTGFLAIFGQNGTFKNAYALGGTGTVELYAVTADAADNIYLGGNYFGTVTVFGQTLTNAGDRNALLVSVKSNGAFNWKTIIPGAAYQSIHALTTINGSDPVIAMAFANIISVEKTDGTKAGHDGGPVADLLVARFDATTGTAKWAQQISAPSDVVIGGIAADASKVALAAHFKGSVAFGMAKSYQNTDAGDDSDGFVAVYHADNGGYQTSTAFIAGGRQRPYGIAIDSFGDFLVTGEYSNRLPITTVAEPANGDLLNYDAFLLKLDENLDGRWSDSFGDKEPQSARAVTVGSARGHVFIGGGFTGTMTGVNPSLTAKGLDAFVIETTN